MAVSFAGYLIGTAFTFSGCITSSMHDYPPDYPIEDQLTGLIPTITFQLIALSFMVIAHVINDKLILYNIRNIDATEHKTASTAVGIVEAASFIGSGFVIGASTYAYVDLEDGTAWGHGLIMFTVFFFVGQTAMVISAHAGNLLDGRDAQHEIMNGNCAAAVFMGARMLATAKLLGDAIGKSDSLLLLVFVYFTGLVLTYIGMLVIRVMFVFIADGKIILKSQILCSGIPFKRNMGHALVEGTSTIAMASVIGTFLRDCSCFTMHFYELNK